MAKDYPRWLKNQVEDPMSYIVKSQLSIFLINLHNTKGQSILKLIRHLIKEKLGGKIRVYVLRSNKASIS